MSARTNADISDFGKAADLIAQARVIAAQCSASAKQLDRDSAFPTEDINRLYRRGLLTAPLPKAHGGIGLGQGDPNKLRHILTLLGRGSLAIGRLNEGHVNALSLVARYGTHANIALMAEEANSGRPSGVWMAGEPLRLEQDACGLLTLRGRKLLCSGAGHFQRPLVAAEYQGGSVMVIPRVADPVRSDASGWVAHGMRATATGTVDFTGIAVVPTRSSVGPEIISDHLTFEAAPGASLPSRSAGSRLCSTSTGRSSPTVPIAITRSSSRVSARRQSPRRRQGSGFDRRRLSRKNRSTMPRPSMPTSISRVTPSRMRPSASSRLRRSAIGLKAFLHPNPMERIIRDLTTYLRQPALDMSLISAAAFHLRQLPGRPA